MEAAPVCGRAKKFLFPFLDELVRCKNMLLKKVWKNSYHAHEAITSVPEFLINNMDLR